MSGQSHAKDLQIAGLTRLSTCDWPDNLVATIFLQGCPLACTYCHNPSILDPRQKGVIQWEEIVTFLSKRVGLLDGVVFSGGEPTMQDSLYEAMREVKEMGFKVGLHTSGIFPKKLTKVLPLCDWVGLDIKAPKHLYEAITGIASSADKAFESLAFALNSGVDLQVRTTVDPMIISPDDILELTNSLVSLGVTDYVLQTVRTEGTRPKYAANLEAFLGLQ